MLNGLRKFWIELSHDAYNELGVYPSVAALVLAVVTLFALSVLALLIKWGFTYPEYILPTLKPVLLGVLVYMFFYVNLKRVGHEETARRKVTGSSR